MPTDPKDVARRCYQAYADSDRSAIERIVADDFHFTSPLDNRIDRATYFERCWPNNETILGFEFVHLLSDGSKVFVTYEAWNRSGKRFRNSEILTVREGRLIDAEVYFGWNVPHEAPAGRSLAPE
jgi:ketosteroid isomerase-like protein